MATAGVPTTILIMQGGARTHNQEYRVFVEKEDFLILKPTEVLQ